MRAGLLYAMTMTFWLTLASGVRADQTEPLFSVQPNEADPIAALLRMREQEQANIRHSAPDLNYKLWRTVCFGEIRGKRCFAFISVDSAFTHEEMLRLGTQLEKRFRRRSKVKAFLFDNARWAEAHASFKAELRDLERHIRGMYYVDRRKCEEYVKFSSSKGEPWDEMTLLLQNLECKKRVRPLNGSRRT